MYVVDLDFVPVVVIDERQIPVDKVHLIVFVIAEFKPPFPVFVDFQTQAVLIIVKTVIFLFVLGEVVGSAVSVGVFQMCLCLV